MGTGGRRERDSCGFSPELPCHAPFPGTGYLGLLALGTAPPDSLPHSSGTSLEFRESVPAQDRKDSVSESLWSLPTPPHILRPQDGCRAAGAGLDTEFGQSLARKAPGEWTAPDVQGEPGVGGGAQRNHVLGAPALGSNRPR